MRPFRWLFVAAACAAAGHAAAQSPALERYQKGEYLEAARLGTTELAGAGSSNAELRFAVANSLAWTGQYRPALEHYRALLGTPFETRAHIGMGNVLRWQGQADLAEGHYRSALAAEPGNQEALRGVELAGRELRPAVTTRLGRTADNQGASLNELSLKYRHWTSDRAWRWEAGVQAGSHETREGDWRPKALQASVWAPRMALAPKLEASLYDNGASGKRLLGGLQVEPLRDVLRLRIARVDWGRVAFSGAATRDGLTATALGAFASLPSVVGEVRARFDAFDISDDNRVYDAEAQITPAWQPLPWQLRWSTGIYGRRAQREDPRYWSPHPAYGVAFVGLQRGWYVDRFDVTASIRRGFAFTETARHSWGASASGRYWLNRDTAIGIEAWGVKAPRPGNYTMHEVAAFLQRLL